MSARIPLKAFLALPGLLAALVISVLAFYDFDPLLLRSDDVARTPDTEPESVEASQREPDCDGDPSAYEAEGLIGRVSYTCGGDVYILTLSTGKVAKVSHGSKLLRRSTWSPDGTKLAYDVGGATAIEVATPGRNSSYRLDTHSRAEHLDWSPDGERIAYVTSVESRDEEGPPREKVLSVMNTDGTRLRTILSEKRDLNSKPILSLDWSPDGKKVLLQSIVPSGRKVALYTVGADGTSLEQIFGNRVVKEMHEAALEHWEKPQYSPDGKKIAFVNNGTSESDPEKRSQIFVVDANGENIRQVTGEPGDKLLASWSPNGEQLLYENLHHEQRDLFVTNTDGTGVKKVTTTQFAEPAQERSPRNAIWLP